MKSVRSTNAVAKKRRIGWLSRQVLAFERETVALLLLQTKGKVGAAAKLAERNRTEFYRLIERHGLDVASYRKQAST